MLKSLLMTLALLAWIGGAIAAQETKSDTKQTAAKKAPPMLHIAGNRILRADGKEARLQGVNIPGMEWSNTGDGDMLKSVRVAMDEWHADTIRLPLNQDRWFGRAEGQKDDGKDYQKRVAEIVAEIAARQGHVILDLHWSDVGLWGKFIGQHKMPDENSVAFWRDIAAKYANHPAVLFGLYNEPRDVSWEIWKDGGLVTENVDKAGTEVTYEAVGLQKLIEVIRETGAKNIVVAGGLDWAYDLSGVAHGYTLQDTQGNGILYDTHIYPWKKDWDAHVNVIAAHHPILVGEVGCEPDAKQEDPKTWGPKALEYIEKNRFHWTAWCFHPGATPKLLQDWDYHPTPYWGVPVKAALSRKTAR